MSWGPHILESRTTVHTSRATMKHQRHPPASCTHTCLSCGRGYELDLHEIQNSQLDASMTHLRQCVFSLGNSDSFYENHEDTLYPQTRITKKGYDNKRAGFGTSSFSLYLQDMFWKMLIMKKSWSKFVKFVKACKPEPKFIKVHKRE